MSASWIASGAVSLRPVDETDYPDIQRWQNDPDVFDLMDYEHPFSLQDITDGEALARIEGHPFVIDLDGRGIGRIGLNQLSTRDHRASLYVFIGEPEEWGKGYGTDAIVALVRYAFDRLDLHLVTAWGLEGNERAFRCYAHCGFMRDATLRDRSFRDGAFRAHVLMSVTRDEFSVAAEAWERTRSPQRS